MINDDELIYKSFVTRTKKKKKKNRTNFSCTCSCSSITLNILDDYHPTTLFLG